MHVSLHALSVMTVGLLNEKGATEPFWAVPNTRIAGARNSFLRRTKTKVDAVMGAFIRVDPQASPARGAHLDKLLLTPLGQFRVAAMGCGISPSLTGCRL